MRYEWIMHIARSLASDIRKRATETCWGKISKNIKKKRKRTKKKRWGRGVGGRGGGGVHTLQSTLTRTVQTAMYDGYSASPGPFCNVAGGGCE